MKQFANLYDHGKENDKGGCLCRISHVAHESDLWIKTNQVYMVGYVIGYFHYNLYVVVSMYNFHRKLWRF